MDDFKGWLAPWSWRVLTSILLVTVFMFMKNTGATLSHQPSIPPVPSDVAYFAYGSSMNDRYIRKIRGIACHSSQLAMLPGYKVIFNISGIPILEPSFANIAPTQDSSVVGVLHQMPEEDFEKIIRSEGPSYRVYEVEVVTQDGASIRAKTLISDPTLSEPVMHSRRYLEFLHEAAVSYGFPAEYLRAYHPDQGAHIPIISYVFGFALQVVVWITARI